MKRKPVPLFRIGLFVLAGFILLIVFIFLLGSKEKLFSHTVTLRARFQTVSSLKKGAQVQLAGINIGSVSDIRLPRNAEDSVEITIKIINDALHLIRKNSTAVISTEGLIGEKLVVVTMGADSLPELAEGSVLTGQEPQDLSKITDTLNRAITQINTVTAQTAEVLRAIQQGQGTIGQLIYNDKLHNEMVQLTEDTRATVVGMRQSVDHATNSISDVASQMNTTVSRINSGQGSIGRLLHDEDVYRDILTTSDNLRQSSYDLRDAMAKFSLSGGRVSEVAEALKHNFLIKGYFEDRGYWDTPEFEQSIDRKIDSLNKLRSSSGLMNNGSKASQ